MCTVHISLRCLDSGHEAWHAESSELTCLAVCCRYGLHQSHRNWHHLHSHLMHCCECPSCYQEPASELPWKTPRGLRWKLCWCLLKTFWNCYDDSPTVSLHRLYLGQMRIWILKTSNTYTSQTYVAHRFVQ